jgi:hypothetical protein
MTSVVSHQSFVPQLHQLSSQMNIGPIGFNSYISHVARIDADTQFNSNRLNLNQMKACIHTFSSVFYVLLRLVVLLPGN